MKQCRATLCQINAEVGNIEVNQEKILTGIQEGKKQQADLIIFPELALNGYPPEDLIHRQGLIKQTEKALDHLIKQSSDCEALIVFGLLNRRKMMHNAAAVLYKGQLIDIYHKIYLPNYGVFDENRYFLPGNRIPVYEFNDIRIGLNICEDIWYPVGPLHEQSMNGCDIAVNISASPYHIGKQTYREQMYRTRAGDEGIVLLNVNMTGGQDELVFDGFSTVYNEEGELMMRMKGFEEEFQTLDIDLDRVYRKRLKDVRKNQEEVFYRNGRNPFETETVQVNRKETADRIKRTVLKTENKVIPEVRGDDEIALLYQALVTGTGDYIRKNGFRDVQVALSGGIDSALVLDIAVSAVGAEHVYAVYLPTRFSADISREDSKKLAENLGVRWIELPIEKLFNQYLELMQPEFKDLPFGLAEENLQARIRGTIVMALSNKFNRLVLTTGNKSEMSTGYATLYGDMAGGFAVIKDVLKTKVYELARFRNKDKEVIPERIIVRPPSAELRENQSDDQSLPSYDVLDKIIEMYVEEDRDLEEIAEITGNREMAASMIRLIDRNEYKRRQAPPGVKVSKRSFGRERRMPITNGYRQE